LVEWRNKGGAIFQPVGMTFDNTGRLYVADPGTETVGIYTTCDVSTNSAQALVKNNAKAAVVVAHETVTPSLTPTVTPTATITSTPTGNPGLGLLQGVAASPNLIRGFGQGPVKVGFTLASPAEVKLSLMTTMGQLVYSKIIEAQTGTNTIVWDLKNTIGREVASGLYVYYIEAAGDNGQACHKTGKIVILH
jgi:FlgD Ig-like domain